MHFDIHYILWTSAAVLSTLYSDMFFVSYAMEMEISLIGLYSGIVAISHCCLLFKVCLYQRM